MKIFGANIPLEVVRFLSEKLKDAEDLKAANQIISINFNITDFLPSEEDFKLLKDAVAHAEDIFEEPDRQEYGDFQTNLNLAISVTSLLKGQGILPETIVEPTCGKGNFIIAALQLFRTLKNIIGVEIYKPYVWECKFNIMYFYLRNEVEIKPLVKIYHCNVFDFDFATIAKENSKHEILIIGNPPWVTNSKLGSLESDNLPTKTNFKKHSGIDAVTGKGNFDIGEYITLMMFDAFQYSNGSLALLLKNSVVKNVVFDQKQRNYKISKLAKYSIDSKKEFNASVEACLFCAQLNDSAEFKCLEYNFYKFGSRINEFGWVNDKFVSNVDYYVHSGVFDGLCPFEWRQGIKHDLSSIMEFERVNGHFVNSLKDEMQLEEDLVYGLLKSSDLKEPIVCRTRKFTIVTQNKPGQNTSFIKDKFPKTFDYLYKNRLKFDQRKSSIYNGKPLFSIFGIGDYSFSPFKVAISALYKNYSFTLVLPQNEKPVMVDDTCYLLGFDSLSFAVYTLVLLNSPQCMELLQAITFLDAKRVFTKDVLMRIDIAKIALNFSEVILRNEVNQLNQNYNLEVNLGEWNAFLDLMKLRAEPRDLKLFI